MVDLRKLFERSQLQRREGDKKKRNLLKKNRDKELLKKFKKAQEQYSKDKKKKKKFDFDSGWPKDMDPGMDPNYRFNLLPEEEKKKRRKLRIPVSKGNLLNKGGSVKLAKKYFKGGLV